MKNGRVFLGRRQTTAREKAACFAGSTPFLSDPPKITQAMRPAGSVRMTCPAILLSAGSQPPVFDNHVLIFLSASLFDLL